MFSFLVNSKDQVTTADELTEKYASLNRSAYQAIKNTDAEELIKETMLIAPKVSQIHRL